jgi:hypothetical protein
MITIDNVRKELNKKGVQVEFLNNPTTPGTTLKTLIDYKVKLSTGEILTIPKGFLYDGPSTLIVVQGLLTIFSAMLLFFLLTNNFFSMWFIPFFMLILALVINHGYEKAPFPGLVHDYLYRVKPLGNITQKQADKEFYIWLKAVNGTTKYSLSNIAIWFLHNGVKIAGKKVY